MHTYPALLALALSAAAAITTPSRMPQSSAQSPDTDAPPAEAIVVTGTRDTEQAAFSLCQGPGRITCVVDGDTFWYRGTKIRIADINAPELGHPGCAYEAELAAAATNRLTELLNAGPFSLAIDGRETDRYGRALRVVFRRGASIGTVLEREGLAEHWHGRRGDWCGA